MSGKVSNPLPRRGGTKRWWILGVIVVLALGFDLGRAPERQVSARVLIAGIDLYQATLSKLMPVVGVQCRFQPTCSHYAEGSLRKYGTLKGSGRAAWRLLRCAPWTEKGTVDPP